jgi:hypothetical protein
MSHDTVPLSEDSLCVENLKCGIFLGKVTPDQLCYGSVIGRYYGYYVSITIFKDVKREYIYVCTRNVFEF